VVVESSKDILDFTGLNLGISYNSCMSHRQEMNTILKLVEDWPAAERVMLAGAIISRHSSSALPPAPRDTYRRALGIGRGDGPPPTDEEVRELVQSHRLTKYGG
jgi:hypothetical protein